MSDVLWIASSEALLHNTLEHAMLSMMGDNAVLRMCVSKRGLTKYRAYLDTA
jgi:hypothetical protein